jgi:DNA-binding MurR/RpiR family transcriptional regulator
MTDSAAKAMGSLSSLLLDYVDTTLVHDSNYDIAQGLLRNYTQLGSMSLRQMANACFVSQASFSRFCRFLGFANFAELKEAVDGADYRLTDDYTQAFVSQLLSDRREAFETYRSAVVDVLGGTMSPDDQIVLDEVLDALEGAGRIAFFSHHFLWHIGHYFQEKMLPLGRYVELYQSHAHQEDSAAMLGDGDVAIVCSMNGSFFSHYGELTRKIYQSGATVVVLTQNRFALHLNRADYVLFCGDSNQNDVGKYAALLTIDLMVMSYIRRLRAGETEDE